MLAYSDLLVRVLLALAVGFVAVVFLLPRLLALLFSYFSGSRYSKKRPLPGS